MFFIAHLGEKPQSDIWQVAVKKYAGSKNLTFSSRSIELADGNLFSFGWLTAGEIDIDEYYCDAGDGFYLSTLLPIAGVFKNKNTDFASEKPELNTTIIRVCRHERDIKIQVPISTPEQMYYFTERTRFVFGNDLRLLLRFKTLELNESAVYALFQFGAIPAPLSISSNISRLPGGYHCTVRADQEQPKLERFSLNREQLPLHDEAEAEDHVTREIRSILGKATDSCLVYFSGGVDSSLLAAELSQMEGKRVLLLNYSFGKNDKEAQFALRMAKELGCECHQITHNNTGLARFLDRIGIDYSYPFADCSSIPTNLLVHSSFDHLNENSTVIEGTGADGIFGVGLKYSMWRKIYAAPHFIRTSADAFYQYASMWRSNSKLRKTLRLLKASHQMSRLHAAALLQNTLNGLAYTIPSECISQIENSLALSTRAFSEKSTPQEDLSIFDIIHVCSAIYAAKSFDPLRSRGRIPLYPFLQKPMLEMILQIPPNINYKDGVAKYIPKKLLARRVPEKMVYRKKSGFKPPFEQMLTEQVLQDFIYATVLSNTNPVLDYVNKQQTNEMFSRAFAGGLLNKEVLNYLWALVFLSAWISANK